MYFGKIVGDYIAPEELRTFVDGMRWEIRMKLGTGIILGRSLLHHKQQLDSEEYSLLLKRECGLTVEQADELIRIYNEGTDDTNTDRHARAFYRTMIGPAEGE